jgi:peroxiredoxin
MVFEMYGRALSPPGRLRKWLNVLPVFAGLCACVVQGIARENEPAWETKFIVVEAAGKSLFSLPSLDGTVHELARHRGRVVLVHFFATWCEPCRAEMASLKQLQSRLESEPFVIVPISVAEADGSVRRFFANDSLPFAVLLDRDRAVARAWNIHTLPSTVVLDRNLRPRLVAEGEVDWGKPDVTKMLADLLGQVPG